MSKLEPTIVQGAQYRLAWGHRDDGTSQAKEYFDGLDKARRAAFLVRFKRFADTGTLPAPRQINWIGGGIFEFKLAEGPRLLSFHAGKRERGLVVVGIGFTKKSPQTPQGQIDRIEALRAEIAERWAREAGT